GLTLEIRWSSRNGQSTRTYTYTCLFLPLLFIPCFCLLHALFLLPRHLLLPLLHKPPPLLPYPLRFLFLPPFPLCLFIPLLLMRPLSLLQLLLEPLALGVEGCEARLFRSEGSKAVVKGKAKGWVG